MTGEKSSKFNDQNNALALAVESPQAFKIRPKDTSIYLSYRTGTNEKPNALRADILTNTHIYRMDIKTKKEKT